MAFPYVTGEESRIQNRKTIIKVIKDTKVVGDGIEDVKTAEELTLKILTENEGKLYKYVGETCSEYEQFAIYQVCLQADGLNKSIQKDDENILIKSDVNNSTKDIVLSIDNSLQDGRIDTFNLTQFDGAFEVLYTIASEEDSIIPELTITSSYASKFDSYGVDKIYFKTIQIPFKAQSWSSTYTFKNRLCAYAEVRDSQQTVCLPLIKSLSTNDNFGFTISEASIQNIEPGNVFSVERKPDGSIVTNVEKKVNKSIDIYIEKYSGRYDKFIVVEENELLLGYQSEPGDDYPTAPDFFSHIIHSCLAGDGSVGVVMIGSGWYKANIPTVGKVDYINPLIEDKNIFTVDDFNKPEYKLIKIK